ncbi:hypothetical protein NHJ13734_009861, partial [Beauveria thailandica]
MTPSITTTHETSPADGERQATPTTGDTATIADSHSSTTPSSQQCQPGSAPFAEALQSKASSTSGLVAASIRTKRTKYDRRPPLLPQPEKPPIPNRDGLDTHEASHHRQREQSRYRTTALGSSDGQLDPSVLIGSPQLLEAATIATLDDGIESEACTKTTFASCTEIKFKPTTLQLLQKCKHQPGEFLQVIGESTAVLPTGQGWEAAIAGKKENADVRDLMKVYHRFECHNIYKHVVEAGFHTGEHWIRNMRTVLIEKLCRDFPERFHDAKTANKCLNWVDQG